MQELVSIVMPSYNTGSLIADSIRSVLNQTYQNWELLIIEDASTDNTEEVLSGLIDNRIKVYKNEKHRGAAFGRNRALKEVKGKWIAFLDSDDLWMPEKLEKQIAFMTDNGYCFSYTNYIELNADGEPAGILVSGPKKITKKDMFNFCWPGCLTVMYDREKVGEIQIEEIAKNNDYAMWLKVCQKADCYLLEEVLAKYRRGRVGSVSSHGIHTMIAWHYKLFREAEKQNVIRAVLNTGRNLLFGIYKKMKYVRRIDA